VPSWKTALGDKAKPLALRLPTALLFEPGRRSAAKLLSKDEARRIAVNFPELLEITAQDLMQQTA
jgi:hypothetical protein